MAYLFIAGEELTVLANAAACVGGAPTQVEIISFPTPVVISRQITVQYFEGGGRNQANFTDLQISSILVTGDVYWVAFWKTIAAALQSQAYGDSISGPFDAELVLEGPAHLIGQITGGRRAILTTSVGRLTVSEDRFGDWNLVGSPTDPNLFPGFTEKLHTPLEVFGDYDTVSRQQVEQVMERQGCGPFDALTALESLGVPVYKPSEQRLVKIPPFESNDEVERIDPVEES